MAINLPIINPNIITFGSFSIRYYSVAYILGIVFAWILIKKFSKYQNVINFDKENISDDFFYYAVIGILLGGRLGYVLFYNFFYYLQHPLEIFYVWQGGMSFHGGFVGASISAYYFCKKNKIDFFRFCDILSVVSPIGLFFGRIANFINMELYGKQTNVPWAMVFPYSDMQPRHPSQLYEALLEGAILFLIMLSITLKTKLKKKYLNTGVFLILYSSFRFFIEFFREPDIQIGYILKYFTMGQLLCLPMLFAGIFFLLKIENTDKN